jgi:hypothetical protein
MNKKLNDETMKELTGETDKEYNLRCKEEKQMNNFPEFQEFKKIPRLSREIVITEKIDGTNGLIYIDGANNIFAGSRSRWLWGSIQNEIHNDNMGFAQWVKTNKEELLKLGKGYHYGEWWGKGIQRGYNLQEKRFSLFNVGRWCLFNEEPKLISIDPKTKIEKYQEKLPECCYVVPILYDGIFDTTIIFNTLKVLELKGSFVSLGFMKPEGIVIYHKQGNIYFKKTIENDEKGKEQ